MMKRLLAALAFLLLPISAMAAGDPSSVIHVPNVAAMQALGPAASLYTGIVTDGYYAAGEGGGYYIWSASSTATTGLCGPFTATGVTTGRFVPTGMMTAKRCGARGHGITLGAGSVAGSCAFSDSTASWVPADVGKEEHITPPVATTDAAYDGLIAAYNSPTSITLTVPCPTWTASGLIHTYGYNDTAALVALNAYGATLQAANPSVLPGAINNVAAIYIEGPDTYLVEGTFHICDSSTTARNMFGWQGVPTISIGGVASNTPVINLGGINGCAVHDMAFNGHFMGDTVVGTASDMVNIVGGPNGLDLENITLYGAPRDCIALNIAASTSIQQGKTKLLNCIQAGRDDVRESGAGSSSTNYANEIDNDTIVLGNPSMRFSGGRYFTVTGGDFALTSWFTHNFKLTTSNTGFTPDNCMMNIGSSVAAPGIVWDSGYGENGGSAISPTTFPICDATGKVGNYHMRNFTNFGWGYQGNIQNFDGGGIVTLGGGATVNIQNVGGAGEYSSFNIYATNLGRNGSNYIANWPIILYGGADSFSASPQNSITASNSLGGSSVTLAVSQSGGTATLTATNNTALAGASFSVTSNVVTYVVASAVNLLVGDTVKISSSADATLDGTWTVTGGTGTSFTFALTHANAGSTPDTGATVKVPSIFTWYNQLQNGIATPVPN